MFRQGGQVGGLVGGGEGVVVFHLVIVNIPLAQWAGRQADGLHESGVVGHPTKRLQPVGDLGRVLPRQVLGVRAGVA